MTATSFDDLRMRLLALMASVRDCGTKASSGILYRLEDDLQALWDERQALARKCADLTDTLTDVREEYATYAIDTCESLVDAAARQNAAALLVDAVEKAAGDLAEMGGPAPDFTTATATYKTEIERINGFPYA